MTDAVLLIAHGTVEDLDDLPAFLKNIRRGHEAPAELVREVRRRYDAIGGKSPLLDVSRSLAAKVERRLGVRTALAMRLWRPYPREVMEGLAREGVDRVVVVPLAQHSAHVYGAAVKEAAQALATAGGPRLEVICAGNWGREPLLVNAFARALAQALQAVPPADQSAATVVMTAHSLPMTVVRAGDAYEDEVRASAAAVAARLPAGAPAHVVAFQSQGAGGGDWLGPDLKTTLEVIAAQRWRHVVIAPIGFLADHVETLYDLDVEARSWCDVLGLAFSRTRSLDDGADLVEAVAAVATPLLSA